MNKNAIYSFLNKHYYVLTAALSLLTIIVLVLTLMPAEMLAQNDIFSYDKIGHLLMFGSWTFLIGLYHNITSSARTRFWLIFVLGLLFGIVIELLQYGIPMLNRHADIYDVLFDGIGCLLAVFALKIIIPENRF